MCSAARRRLLSSAWLWFFIVDCADRGVLGLWQAAYRKSDYVADEEAAEPDFQPMAPPMEYQEDISDEIVAVIAAAVAAMASRTG